MIFHDGEHCIRWFVNTKDAITVGGFLPKFEDKVVACVDIEHLLSAQFNTDECKVLFAFANGERADGIEEYRKRFKNPATQTTYTVRTGYRKFNALLDKLTTVLKDCEYIG
jgi:hypothetical protein